MDRLISEQEVLDVIASWFESTEQQRILQGRIKAIPSVEPYKGMTNGEVMKKIFKGVIHHIDGQPYLDYCYEN